MPAYIRTTQEGSFSERQGKSWVGEKKRWLRPTRNEHPENRDNAAGHETLVGRHDV
jgi:hypothetical protein